MIRFPEINKGPVEPDLTFLLDRFLVWVNSDAGRRPRRHDHRLGRDRFESVVLAETRHLTDQRINAEPRNDRVNR